MTWLALRRGMAWNIASMVVRRRWRDNTTIRRRDKSGSPVVIQVIDMTCLSPCRTVGSRAALWQSINLFNAPSGTALPKSRKGSQP